MPKTTSGFNPAEYATVAERVALFRAAYPFGFIVTRQASRDEQQVTFVAEVYRHADDPRPAATGWASERFGDGEINVASCVENTETSAVGRALANLGFSVSRRYASLDEMLAAARRSARAPRTPHAPLHLVREARPADAAPSDGPDVLQETADALADALGQLAQAERMGLPPRDASRLRRSLDGRLVPPSAIARAERELRIWFEAHVPAPRLDVPASPIDEPPPGGPAV